MSWYTAKQRQFCFSAGLCELFLVSVHMGSFTFWVSLWRSGFCLFFHLRPKKTKKKSARFAQKPHHFFKVKKALNSRMGPFLTWQFLVCSILNILIQAVPIKSSYTQSTRTLVHVPACHQPSLLMTKTRTCTKIEAPKFILKMKQLQGEFKTSCWGSSRPSTE